MKRKYVYLYLLGLLLFSVACTGNFRDYNTDLSGITDDDLIIDDNGYGIRLGIIQQGIYFNYDYGKGKNWPFQLIQNLNADMFSGYMHDGKPLNGGSHNSDYNMQDGWNSAMWTHMYSYIFPQIYQSENATRNTHPALFGITKILKVEAMHRVTDYYGPIIYKNFANAEKHYRPDKQEDVYYEFFNELDSAVVALTNYIDEKPESNGFARFDILLDGKYASWVKFANSLRLRLAMRIASVAPDKACAEIQKIKENDYGFFEAETGGAIVSTKSGYTNPLGELNRVWNETYMSANMESILVGYDDPRLGAYFEHCTDEALKGQYRGIRQGTCFAHSHYSGLSKLFVLQSTDAPLMTAEDIPAVAQIEKECFSQPWSEQGFLDGMKDAIFFVAEDPQIAGYIGMYRMPPEGEITNVTLEFDLFADLQSAGRVENLHVGIVAHDLDDLGHHLGIPAVNVTDFVLADRAVRLHDHDVRDDTVYSSCCFHYLFYCLLIKSLPSRLVIRRCSISRPCLSSKRVQRATMFTFTR